MKVLFPALRVSHLDASLAFYTAVGFEVVGRVEGSNGTRMAMMALPTDDEVTLELVHSAVHGSEDPGGLDHLAIQVDDLEATRARLVLARMNVDPVQTPGGHDGPRTVTVVDPDGYHLELVQWPPGHPTEMVRADFEPAPRTEPTNDRKDAQR
jgi:lactoylglutathione lyase